MLYSLCVIVAPEMQANNRNPDGTFKEGVSGNPNGRPVGKSLKEFARLYLLTLSPEDKLDYLASLPPEIVWRMAEGNPTEDRNVKISVPVPILGGSSQALTVEASDLLEDTTQSSPHTTSDTPQDGL